MGGFNGSRKQTRMSPVVAIVRYNRYRCQLLNGLITRFDDRVRDRTT